MGRRKGHRGGAEAPAQPVVTGDSLAREAVAPLLRGRFGHVYVYAERCASTQRLLDPALPEGAVAVAEEQTEGRGRLGRPWIAPPRTSILCSTLLRPPVDPARLPHARVSRRSRRVEPVPRRRPDDPCAGQSSLGGLTARSPVLSLGRRLVPP
ncbi:MAG: hypothetical protein M3292_11405 [Actinomycetota bacterium]|nr:hypothetical protein [Actinomycetota bacterium]